MSISERIDAESRGPLKALLEALPGGFNAIADIQARRDGLTAAITAASADVPENPNVEFEDCAIPNADGSEQGKVRIYRPVNAQTPLPGIFYIHGGGMVLSNLENEHGIACMLCDQLKAVVVSV